MSELTKRIVSGVLLAVLLLADLWLGSYAYAALLIIGGVVVGREYYQLVMGITRHGAARLLWLVFGAAYIGAAMIGLWNVRAIPESGLLFSMWLFFIVWGTDVGAYIFGRVIGGPKIAPSISPSKTWAGLFGGAVFVLIIMYIMGKVEGLDHQSFAFALYGVPLAVLAQAGDFFESWMKRRAGVKDSGTLIPGHGGLFDRVDGLLPVAIVFPWWMGFGV